VEYVTTSSSRLAPVFSWADAMATGLTRRQGNGLAPQRVTQGYYARPEMAGSLARIDALLTIAGPKARICGATSLKLAGVDLPARLARDTRVWHQVPSGQCWPRRPGVRLVRSDPTEAAQRLRGWPTAPLATCWTQLALECTVDELVEVADALTRRQRPRSTTAALEAAIRQRGRARGMAKARQALAWCVPGTDSIPETDLRLVLVRAGLPVPKVNLAIRDRSGRVVFRLDLAYEDLLVAIEYDGSHHGDQLAQDATRRRWLEDQGWRIITVTSTDLVTDPDGVVASVRQARLRATRLAPRAVSVPYVRGARTLGTIGGLGPDL